MRGNFFAFVPEYKHLNEIVQLSKWFMSSVMALEAGHYKFWEKTLTIRHNEEGGIEAFERPDVDFVFIRQFK